MLSCQLPFVSFPDIRRKHKKGKGKDKRKTKTPKRKRAFQEEKPFKVHVGLDMWPIIKKGKAIYDCPFTLYIDVQFYSNSKVSVFDPKVVFGKIEADFTPYLKNFL